MLHLTARERRGTFGSNDYQANWLSGATEERKLPPDVALTAGKQMAKWKTLNVARCRMAVVRWRFSIHLLLLRHDANADSFESDHAIYLPDPTLWATSNRLIPRGTNSPVQSHQKSMIETEWETAWLEVTRKSKMTKLRWSVRFWENPARQFAKSICEVDLTDFRLQRSRQLTGGYEDRLGTKNTILSFEARFRENRIGIHQRRIKYTRTSRISKYDFLKNEALVGKLLFYVFHLRSHVE